MDKLKLALSALSISLAMALVFGCASKQPKPVDRQDTKDISRDVDQILEE